MPSLRTSTLAIILLAAFGRLTAQPIDTVETPGLNGIRHYLKIKSNDRSKPVLLFLHGGPGGSVMAYSEKFTKELQSHFVVVQWDQRQTGKTLELNSSPDSLNFDLFSRDTHECIRYLLQRFQQQKLYLVGHSWGTALGFDMVKHYPGLLHAFVAVGPMIQQIESERLVHRLMMQRAQERKDKESINQLSSVQIPFENGDQLFLHRKCLFNFVGSKTKLSKSYVLDWASTWLKTYNEACAIDLFQTLPKADCPVYVFAGRKDYQTNAWIAERYVSSLIAPRKHFEWFEHSGHGIPTSEPDKFQRMIIERVLTETQNTSH